ncbi:hypothetical protein GUITHDRAFT_131845 [Guillardia theta CCMP2712]|uniref:Cation efflux protein transmembrane domain-containing protein n=2 Tax=Guillardia theta TaxID=55529 RepID=L1K330_GUITC|nr:hypothetical protein GUITHDRAFT_131845 [Guillardia theta CCMP2712]EKX54850.1 hypothetical protein GUITHDRAFT_131845 [Guillardia theta CCMP2712]|eukprot:XP_005841830.1 hypothetical protein GUITHDRAFT_131845 [Guillardia theta CCMP2712]
MLPKFLSSKGLRRGAAILQPYKEYLNIFSFISCLQATLLLSEYVYAEHVGSVLLKAHSFHVAIEFIEGASRILSSFYQRKPADTVFTYGYGRFPILLEYCCATVIVMLCSTLAIDALVRLKYTTPARDNAPCDFEQNHLHTTDLTVPSCLFATFFLAIVTMAHRAKQFSNRYNYVYQTNTDTGSKSLLAVLGRRRLILNFLTSLMIVASSFMLRWTKLNAVDSIAGFFLILMVIPALHQIVTRTCPILLQKAPAGPRAAFDKATREIATFEEVVECSSEHFWVQSPGVSVGTVAVRLRSQVDTQEILNRIRNRFAGAVTELTVQIETADSFGSAPRVYTNRPYDDTNLTARI